MTKTGAFFDPKMILRSFGSFEYWKLDLVSGVVIRISDLILINDYVVI